MSSEPCPVLLLAVERRILLTVDRRRPIVCWCKQWYPSLLLRVFMKATFFTWEHRVDEKGFKIYVDMPNLCLTC
jgi:hypothetical protein